MVNTSIARFMLRLSRETRGFVACDLIVYLLAVFVFIELSGWVIRTTRGPLCAFFKNPVLISLEVKLSSNTYL